MRHLSTILFLLGFFALASNAQDVRYLTTAQFKELVFDYTKEKQWHYAGDKPCIIDFYTTWCGPCKRLAPIMEELSEQFCDEVIFYKVDTERERELAYYFQINSIPQILFVPTDDRPQMAKGLLPKETLIDAIHKILLKKQ